MLFGQTLTLLGQFYKCLHYCNDVSVSGDQQEFIENSQYHMDGPKALKAACVRAWNVQKFTALHRRAVNIFSLLAHLNEQHIIRSHLAELRPASMCISVLLGIYMDL